MKKIHSLPFKLSKKFDHSPICSYNFPTNNGRSQKGSKSMPPTNFFVCHLMFFFFYSRLKIKIKKKKKKERKKKKLTFALAISLFLEPFLQKKKKKKKKRKEKISVLQIDFTCLRVLHFNDWPMNFVYQAQTLTIFGEELICGLDSVGWLFLLVTLLRDAGWLFLQGAGWLLLQGVVWLFLQGA